jgi:hypothetical protein
MSKNRMVLMSFVNFCAVNPDLRFWQALAAWAGGTIFIQNTAPKGELITDLLQREPSLRDTFYWEGHRG